MEEYQVYDFYDGFLYLRQIGNVWEHLDHRYDHILSKFIVIMVFITMFLCYVRFREVHGKNRAPYMIKG